MPVLAFLLTFMGPIGYATEPPANEVLFILERNTNRNQVVYELKHADESQTTETIHPYWRMLARDGHLEELNSIEKSQIYGVDQVERTRDFIRFEIAALPSYPIMVLRNSGSAFIHLLGEDRVIKRVFVHVSGGLIPSVDSIEIDCQTQDSAAIQSVVLTPAPGEKWQETLKSK